MSIRDIGTGQMQKPQIVAYFLVPADQHAPKTVHPTMRSTTHRRALQPVSCFSAWASSPRAWMSREAKLCQKVPDLIIVIAGLLFLKRILRGARCPVLAIPVT